MSGQIVLVLCCVGLSILPSIGSTSRPWPGRQEPEPGAIVVQGDPANPKVLGGVGDGGKKANKPPWLHALGIKKHAMALLDPCMAPSRSIMQDASAAALVRRRSSKDTPGVNLGGMRGLSSASKHNRGSTRSSRHHLSASPRLSGRAGVAAAARHSSDEKRQRNSDKNSESSGGTTSCSRAVGRQHRATRESITYCSFLLCTPDA